MTVVLEAKNIHFSYPDGYKALDGVSFQAHQGEIIALLGANGCGKTTFFQHFNGLLKPEQGEIMLKGDSLKNKGINQVFKTVGLVFQDPNDQLFAANVYNDISYGPTNLGLPEEEINKKVNWAIELMELQEIQHKAIHTLSFGQKKRVAIAGILALEPEIMVLDEPTAGLDPVGASKLMHLLKSIQKETNLTIILSTHEVDIVPIYCNRVYVMNKGRISLEGTPETVFAQAEVLRGLNLRLPRVAHLVEVLGAKDGWNIVKPGLTISQARKALNSCLQDKLGGHN
ncbi:MAG: ATP-binding cassette domain-containing protein [Carboxydocellales bacterium]